MMLVDDNDADGDNFDNVTVDDDER